MIIHCTQKLAKNLKEVTPERLAETSLLGSWHANLYTIDSRKCVMFCHDATRYILFAAGLKKPDFMELGAVHRKLFLEALTVQGIPSIQIKKAELALGPAVFDYVTERSVLGAMNIVRFDLAVLLQRVRNVMELKPVEVALFMNRRPTQAGKIWMFPNDEIVKLLSLL
jgi:hypothetical protein